MNAPEILNELRSLGKESYKRTLMKNHGVREPFYGVPIAELKKIQKRVKKDYQLALDLYATGNYDAMYLAGLVADSQKMSKKDLQGWVNEAYAPSLASWTVPLVAAESRFGMEMALKWIESKKPLVAGAGWATLSMMIGTTSKVEGRIDAARRLIERVDSEIHQAPDLVRYHMNGFIIAVGSYIDALKEVAIAAAEKIGRVTADLGNNDCQVPYAPDYIRKVRARRSARAK